MAQIFDPFPFPDATAAQRAAIADLAEELDATRKAALAEVPRLTMTEIYNLRDKQRAGQLAEPMEEERAAAARLVALNATRAAEEKAGQVRWLRPDYQRPRFGAKPA